MLLRQNCGIEPSDPTHKFYSIEPPAARTASGFRPPPQMGPKPLLDLRTGLAETFCGGFAVLSLAGWKHPSVARMVSTDEVYREFGREKSLRERPLAEITGAATAIARTRNANIQRTIFSVAQRANPQFASEKIVRQFSAASRPLRRCAAQYSSGGPHPRHDY